MSKALELKGEDFQKEVLESEIPVVVDFWAPWCGPCQMMGPVIDAAMEEFAGKAKIVKINVDEESGQQIASKYDVQGIPNIKIFKNGEVIKNMVGFQPQESFFNEIKNCLN